MRSRIPPQAWLIAPAVGFVVAFTLYPSLYGVYLSTTNLHFGYVGMRFIGLANYSRLLGWGQLGQVLRNTAVFVSATVVLQMGVGLLIALLLNKRIFGTRFVRTVAILPWVLPAIVLGLMFSSMVSGSKFGILNHLLSFFSVPPRAWINDPVRAMLILVLALTWRGTAFSVILQLGGLQTIPEELYEAARIDGSRSVATFFLITLPLLKHSLMVNLIMASAGTLNHVDIPLSLTGGGPEGATEVLSLSVYRQAFELLDAGFASTLATGMLFINLALTVVYLRALRER